MISYSRPTRTEGVLMRRMRTGRDAAPEGSVSSAKPPGASGDTARPNYMGPSGNGLVGADERGGKPAESRAFRLSAAPVRFQKAVSRSKEKRRGEAPIGALARVMGRPFPSAEGTGFAVRPSHRVRRSAPAPDGASPPRMGAHPQTAAGRPLPRNDGDWFNET